MTKGTIYDIEGQLLDLYVKYEEAETDEEREDILQQIAVADMSLADKADGYARLMKNAQGEAAMLGEEIKRLQAKKKARENLVESLKETMLRVMQTTETPKIQTGIGAWSIRKNPLSVNIIDDSAIPAEYRTPQPDKIDKDGIKKLFKETGEVFEGVEYVTDAVSAQLR